MHREFAWKTRPERLRVVDYWWEQQQGVCCICNGKYGPMTPYRTSHFQNDPLAATLEHLIPKRDGGPNTVGNVRLAHGMCNFALGALWNLNQHRLSLGLPPMSDEWALANARAQWDVKLARRAAARAGQELPPERTRVVIELDRQREPKGGQRPRPIETARENHAKMRQRKAERRIRDRAGDSPRPIVKVIDEHGFPKFMFGDEPSRPAAIAPTVPVLPRAARAQLLEPRKAVPMARPKRKKPVCSKCGSDDVTMDGLLAWDVDRQAWVASAELDNVDCNACCGETSVNWIDPEAPTPAQFGPRPMTATES